MDRKISNSTLLDFDLCFVSSLLSSLLTLKQVTRTPLEQSLRLALSGLSS